MNLKEKLAKEYTDALPCPYTEAAKELIADDFIAGFEKAREMAAQHFHDSWTNPKYTMRPYQSAMQDIGVDTASLGEQEVDG